MTVRATETCALCPRLCRSACPVAAASGREAAVPAVIAEVVLGWRRGRVAPALALEAASMCVDCGACQAYCHLHVPLPDALREARHTLAPPPQPMGPVRGRGDVVAIEHDARAWHDALAAREGIAVAWLRTDDALGLSALGGPRSDAWLDTVRRHLAGVHPVVAHGGVAKVLDAAGVPYTWLHRRLGLLDARTGCTGPAGQGHDAHRTCCGGAEPLRSAHPDVAAHLARRAPAGAIWADARCRDHVGACGIPARDAVDVLLEVA